MSTTPMSLAQFGQTVKAKHPEYNDIPDDDLGQRVLAKYPQYKDMVQQGPSLPAPSPQGLANQALQGTGIQVGPQPNPIKNIPVQGDNPVVRAAVAAGATLPSGPGQKPILGQGRSPLQVMSEQPLPFGSPSSAAEMVAEPARRIGSGDVAGGLGEIGGQAAQMYAIKKAADLTAKPATTPAGSDLVRQAASERFNTVKSAAGNVSVDLTDPGNIALRTQELAQSGGSMPKVVRDFLKRATDPTQPPMTYSEARDFYSNATRLSADEFNRLTPVMRSQVAQFTKSLGNSITNAAGTVGQAENYTTAMGQYRQAAKMDARSAAVQDLTTKLVKMSIPAGIAGYIAKEVISGHGK